MKDLEGKVAFITGGSSGIGLGVALAFVEAGMKVVIGYRTREHLEEAIHHLKPAQGRVHAVELDVTNRAEMAKAAAETIRVFGKIHILVNNAGVTLPPLLNDTSDEDWRWVMEVNVTGVFNGVRLFLPHIKAHGEGGHIITTSSILGLFNAGAGQGAYCVSKFAVVGMMEALRAELMNTHIGVSVFCPGVVRTNIVDFDRNRRPSQAQAEVSTRKRAIEESRIAMDAFEAGRHVLRGLRNNDLYIFSHPEFKSLIQLRHEAMLASMPTDERPTEPRAALARSMLEGSIYRRSLS